MIIEIMGEFAEAHRHDGTRESALVVQRMGILCDCVVDHLKGEWWLTFLSPARGGYFAAPGSVIVRFEDNDFVALSAETFAEVATVLDE
jgi:hypothetical protein